MPTLIPSNEPNKPTNRLSLALAIAFAGVALLLRFAPLPENFACIGGLALFSGMALRGPARWFVPLLTLFTADCIGHFMNVPGMGFYSVQSMAINYLGFAAFIAIGSAGGFAVTRFRRSFRLEISVVCAVVGSFVYFLISNFGSWLDPLMGYPRTVDGLIRCYGMAIPFWRSSLISDLCFGVGFVAVGSIVESWVGAHQTSRSSAS